MWVAAHCLDGLVPGTKPSRQWASAVGGLAESLVSASNLFKTYPGIALWCMGIDCLYMYSLLFSSSEVKLQTHPKGFLHLREGY